MLNAILKFQFIRFAVVGAFGFFVDGLGLVLLIAMDWSLFPARAVSFACAVSITWYVNRMWTFNKMGVAKARVVKQYGYYLTVQLIGAGINFGTFFLVIYWFPYTGSQPLIALAVGAVVAMGFNYVLAKKVVYTK
ncbi:GtrA family protein [Candidatus Njordibacter sp. Uisw_039]|uniref:GtrA family protein n=1 Tax=Candidatus Njordibacter sp. Uisw_039 TaxID=3230972 RepID=UPI003D46FE42